LVNKPGKCWTVKYHKASTLPNGDLRTIKAVQMVVTRTGQTVNGKFPISIDLHQYVDTFPSTGVPTRYLIGTWGNKGNRITLTGQADDLRGGQPFQKRPLHLVACEEYVEVDSATGKTTKHLVTVHGVVFSNRTQVKGKSKPNPIENSEPTKADYYRMVLRIRDKVVPSEKRDVKDESKPLDEPPCDGPVTDDILEESDYIPPATSEDPEEVPDYSLPYDGYWSDVPA
jgi:hypothetical protein